MLYSFIIPCYKSDQTIQMVVKLISEEMIKLNKTNFEFILVNDCSPDDGKTMYTLIELVKKYSNIKIIDLAKNAGQHNAIMAGLNYSEGDVLIGMDDDMQTHPSQLQKLFEEFEKGYDIVYGYYPQKKHSLFKNIGSKINYWSVRILIGKPKDLKSSSYWIIKRFVRDNVIKYNNSYAYLQGLFLRTTNNISSIPIQHFKREIGESNYTFKKLIKLWSSIIGFSVIPLRMASYLGYAFSLLSIIGTIAIVISKIIKPTMAVGWASTMVGICFFSGINLLFMGLLGEYIGRMFLGMNNEPQYVVRNIITKKGDDNK